MRKVLGLALALAAPSLPAPRAAAALAEQCAWPPPGGPAVAPGSVQVEMAPVVGDLDGDGSPEIVVVTFTEGSDDGSGHDGVLRILRGADCSEIATSVDPGCVSCFGDAACRSLDITDDEGVLCPACGVAIADLDGDGRMEIVAVSEEDDATTQLRRLVVYDHAGRFLRCTQMSTEWIGPVSAPALADVDGDGSPDGVARATAWSLAGPLLWSQPPSGLGLSAIADLDGDGIAEVLTGSACLRGSDGAVLWVRPDLNVSSSAVADLDLDCVPEVITSSRSAQSVSVLDAFTGVTRAWAPIPAGDCPPRIDGQGGAPTLADVDGDCVPEIGVAGCRRYAFFGWAPGPPEQLVLRWESPIDDATSRFTSSAIFDLDADGTSEVLYNDQRFFRVHDAVTGAVEQQMPNSTSTLAEFPTVADCDGDLRAEVVLSANDYTYCCDAGVRVVHDDAVPWAFAPTLFNQHAFHVTNVLPDGRIPRREEASWMRYNSYRVQGPPVRSPQGPVLSGIPADESAPCDAIPPAASPTAQGGCGESPSVTLSEERVGGACGELRRTWTAVDRCGRASSRTQVVTLTDAVPPVIAGIPADATLACPERVSAPAAASVDDDCDPAPSLRFEETRTSSCPGAERVVRTWTARDACGNVATATQVIEVVDVGSPALVVPPDARVTCAAPPPATPSVSDDCDPAPSVSFDEQRTPGACPYSYRLVRTWTATDACGNRATARQVIDVVDESAPVLSGVPADARVTCAAPPVASPSASDDCDPAPTVSFDEQRIPGACPHAYRLVRTWTATDACGNRATARQVIDVVDESAPVLSGVPADARVTCAAPPVASPSASDDCDPAPAVSFDEQRIPGACPYSYRLVRTWTATDACGNAATARQVIDVVDESAPVLSVPPDAVVECGDPLPPGAASASDACDPAPVVTMEEARTDGRCPGEYTLVRTFTATDACGNAAVSRQVIRVVDTTPPTIAGEQTLCLWSPNHWVACLGPEYFQPTVQDACGGNVAWRFAGCVSDQPEDALGDGAFRPDCVIDADGRLCVRSERQGMVEEGRHYGVLAIAVDACGNASEPESIGTIWIPRDQRTHPDCLKIQDVADKPPGRP